MNISEVVPQFFFDLIARIIPGLMFIVCSCLTADWLFYELKYLILISKLPFFITLAAGYIVGSILLSISLLASDEFKKEVENKIKRELSLGVGNVNSSKKYSEDFQKTIRETMIEEFYKDGKITAKDKFDNDMKEKGKLMSIIYIWFYRIRNSETSEGIRIAKTRAEYHFNYSLFITLSSFGFIILVLSLPCLIDKHGFLYFLESLFITRSYAVER